MRPRSGTRRLTSTTSLLAVALCCSFVAAQEPGLTPDGLFGERESSEEEGEFETDRDSFTPATTTVDEGRLMLESAWSYIDNRDVADTHSLPELVLRYGATDTIELRFGTNYEVGGESSSVTGSEFSEGDGEEAGDEVVRETAISYGFKAFLTRQEGLRPESSLIVMGSTPASGPENASSVVCTYAFGWTFANDWKWDSALRYGTGRVEDDDYNRWAPSTVLKVPVGEHWDVHAEYFATFSEGRAAETEVHYFSPGVAYRLNEHVEIGVRVGVGLNDEASNCFSNIGIGWQF
jgi:hypothetical protein